MQKKCREISSNTYFAKWFYWNVAKYQKILFYISWNFVVYLVSRNEICQILQILLHEISRNFSKNFAKLRNKNFAKYRVISFREIFVATLVSAHKCTDTPLLSTLLIKRENKTYFLCKSVPRSGVSLYSRGYINRAISGKFYQTFPNQNCCLK